MIGLAGPTESTESTESTVPIVPNNRAKSTVWRYFGFPGNGSGGISIYRVIALCNNRFYISVYRCSSSMYVCMYVCMFAHLFCDIRGDGMM